MTLNLGQHLSKIYLSLARLQVLSMKDNGIHFEEVLDLTTSEVKIICYGHECADGDISYLSFSEFHHLNHHSMIEFRCAIKEFDPSSDW